MMGSITLDTDVLKLFAETTAKAAAASVVEGLRADMKEVHEETRRQVGEQIRAEFAAHFGQMDPAKHIVQHDRLERLLKLSDKLGENIIGKILTNLIIGVCAVALVGYVAWHKLVG